MHQANEKKPKSSWGYASGVFAWLMSLCSMSPALCWAQVADAPAVRWNLPLGVTSISRDVYYLHMAIFAVCVAIACVVFGVMLYALVRHRKARGHQAAAFHENLWVEIVWTVIPFLILIAMAIPATRVLRDMHNFEASDMTVQVTGYQWKWKYEYLGEGLSFFSNLSSTLDQIHNKEPKGVHYLLEVDKPLVLPINKKVLFLFTSNDVIHSWWVPEFGFKKDTIPGFINQAWVKIEKPGIYRGQCAELCGLNHGYMPIVVEAKTQADYDAWLAEQKAAKLAAENAAKGVLSHAVLMEKGAQVYRKACAVCHQAEGQGLPPAFPALKGSAIVLNDRAKHIDIVLHGVPGTSMQAFDSQLSDAEIAAVVTYERNAFGNNTGDLVQASDIAAARSAARGQ